MSYVPVYPCEAEHGHILAAIPLLERERHVREYDEWRRSLEKVQRPGLKRAPDGTWSA